MLKEIPQLIVVGRCVPHISFPLIKLLFSNKPHQEITILLLTCKNNNQFCVLYCDLILFVN
jgi:hypothetical protein